MIEGREGDQGRLCYSDLSSYDIRPRNTSRAKNRAIASADGIAGSSQGLSSNDALRYQKLRKVEPRSTVLGIVHVDLEETPSIPSRRFYPSGLSSAALALITSLE